MALQFIGSHLPTISSANPPNSAHNQFRQAIDKNSISALLISMLLNSGIDDSN